VSYSIEMGQDVPGLGAELASLIAEAKDTEEEAVFTVGIGGANTCLGIAPAHGTVGMYTHINLGVDHTLAATDAYAVEAALPIRHRMGAAWFMNRAIIRAFQALETSNGQLFGGLNYAAVGYPQNSIVGATGLELLRYPIVESPSMPSVYAGAGDDLKSMALLVNLKASYVIVDRIGMSVEFVPHLFHADGKLPIGARGLYALWRNGAEVVNLDGGRILTSTAA
jgi:HK97 family phage major capsid protein